MNPAATVLIPTHDHTECLRHSIGSVLDQTLRNFELLVVGDGVQDPTRAIIAELSAQDSRIRFFDLPKGARKGERHRHTVLQEHATGRFVAYLGDDDVWMPNHLEVMANLLEDADFGHTLHVGIEGTGELVFIPADLENPEFRARMLNEPFNCFDFTFGGHSLEAYRRLRQGWEPPPPDCPWSDLHLWRQFLAQSWCRAKSAMIPTGICTMTHRRPHLTDRARAEELAKLRRDMNSPAFREGLWRRAAKRFSGMAVSFELAHRAATRSGGSDGAPR